MQFSSSQTIRRFLDFSLATLLVCFADVIAHAAEPGGVVLTQQFESKVRPFLHTYCQACHSEKQPKAKLDLTRYASLADVAKNHATWQLVLERLEAKEMPPEEAKRQPGAAERQVVVQWIRDFRATEAERNAGDPGIVPVRRLNSAEYNYTIRDLTGVDIRPAREFPIDPANEAGFDNSADSLAMSPALLQKYVEAARFVADHLVLKPRGFDFAPHPVMTDTDRDKYCVKRIVQFYQRQPTDYAAYFLAAWRFRHGAALGRPAATLPDIAAAEGISPKYLATVWSALTELPIDVGPMAKLQSLWRELPAPEAQQPDAALAGCQQMRHWITELRRKLEPKVRGLKVQGIHEGAQAFVLWKNRQYTANRRTYDRTALVVKSESSDAAADSDLTVPSDPAERARYEASFAKFCDVFPDAFYISERGRDYVGKPKEQQEKGRLLSAGFHSMMGYFRDDGPLYDMLLNEPQKVELDSLWHELDFIASAPMRQYQGFLWFERTDSRYLRDEEFDFARAEDKDAGSDDKIKRLAEAYLAKARGNGGEGVALEAITDYFQNMNAAIRWVEQARLSAEPSHLESLLKFAERAYRRPLSPAERDDLLAFYRKLRGEEISHEEAIQDAVVSVLMSPFFCYRMDLAESGTGKRSLTDYELASRLSFFLWSSMPDQELLVHAAAGDLHQPEVLLAQTRRMLKDGRIRGLAVEFGGNWLDFRHFQQHNSVDRSRFPTFSNELRDAMFEEPIRFFVDLVQHDGSVLDFLYARHTFVNQTLASHYGLPELGVGPDDWLRLDDAAPYGRGGLLPMGVFLTQNAPGLRTSPVKRGYWVVRRLLGERIPPPPPNVPELPSDEAKLGDLTLRETLARHRDNASCATCHQRFDALGLVFEGYGPIGERRERDLGGRLVDTKAAFPGGSEGAGLDGLKSYLHDRRQEEFLDNLCRKLLSYALGRTLLPSDDRLLRDLREKLTSSEYRFGNLVENIVTSPQFLTKLGGSELTRE